MGYNRTVLIMGGVSPEVKFAKFQFPADDPHRHDYPVVTVTVKSTTSPAPVATLKKLAADKSIDDAVEADFINCTMDSSGGTVNVTNAIQNPMNAYGRGVFGVSLNVALAAGDLVAASVDTGTP